MQSFSVKATVVQVVKHILCEKSVQQRHKFESHKRYYFISYKKKSLKSLQNYNLNHQTCGSGHKVLGFHLGDLSSNPPIADIQLL